MHSMTKKAPKIRNSKAVQQGRDNFWGHRVYSVKPEKPGADCYNIYVYRQQENSFHIL